MTFDGPCQLFCDSKMDRRGCNAQKSKPAFKLGQVFSVTLMLLSSELKRKPRGLLQSQGRLLSQPSEHPAQQGVRAAAQPHISQEQSEPRRRPRSQASIQLLL